MEMNPTSLEAVPTVEGDLETLLPLEEPAKSRGSRWRLAAALAGACAVGLLGKAVVLPKGAQPFVSKMDAAISYAASLPDATDNIKDTKNGKPVYHGDTGDKEILWTIVFQDMEDADYKALVDGHKDKIEWSGEDLHMIMIECTYSDLQEYLDDFGDDFGAKIDYVAQDSPSMLIPDDKHTLSPDRRLAAASWGIDRSDQRALPLNNNYAGKSQGKGAHVYVFDTGIRCTHDDLKGRCEQTVQFVGRWRGGGEVCRAGDANCAGDKHGHGTHCAGSVAGTTYGVAPQANLHSVKVLADSGGGSFGWIIQAADWVATNGKSPAIISASLGGAGIVRPCAEAFNKAIGHGVTIVVAAGNENSDACRFSPAFIPAVITVGSIDSADKRSGFSNYGNCVDIFAPGSGIVSAAHTGDTASTGMSGTSMACPHVAGAAALSLAADKSLKPSCRHASGDCSKHKDDLVQPLLSAMLTEATPDVVHDHKEGSPDKLLYVGTGADAPAPTTPAPPSAEQCQTMGWKITSGDCNIDADCCLTSPNYPSNYPNDGKCEVVVGSNPGKMVDTHFDTESGYDRLEMKVSDHMEHIFHGQDGPHNYVPLAGNTITWSSDYSVNAKGFKVCMQIDTAHLCPANGWKKKESCVDKFNYQGTEYDGCSTADHHGGWCVTKITHSQLFYADCDRC